jgi:hypothetical protein
MHYFIDHSQLPTQNSADTFGADSSDPTNKFNITSRFQLTGQAKAFACQDSLMIVQKSNVGNNTLVNVILKPIEGLKIPFNSVKYFVYRGLLKDRFIIGTAIKPKSQAHDNSFLKRFWDNVDSYNANATPANQISPTPQSFGYDDTLSNTLDIEKIYDNSQTDVRAIFVKEGEWIGDFGTAEKIGFEIILETDSFFINNFNYRLDLNYLRVGSKIIDVSGLSGFDKRVKQELILSYIDPAAFFGLHYDAGVNISVFSGGNKTLEKKKQNDIYTLLLDKFATKNRVYLDIRSEKGYSYNFYQNYKGPIGDPTYGTDLLIGDDYNFQSNGFYQENGWPIKFFESTQTTSANENKMFIALRTDDNTKPILFTDEKFKKSGNRFLSGTQLYGSVWTQPIEFAIPNTGSGSTKNNIAYCIKLQYFRGEYNSSSPNTVLKNENYFDSAFCPIDLPNLADSTYLFKQVHNSDLNFVRGVLPNIATDFGYVADSGAIWDDDRIIFYSQAIFQTKRTGQFFPEVPSGGNSTPGFSLNSNFAKLSLIARDIKLSKKTIQQSTGGGNYEEIKLLDISHYNGFPASKENFLSLGVTRDEFTALKSITGFSATHHRYIFLEEDTNSPYTDINGSQYRKYKLKVQGLNSNGEQTILPPSTNIFVYTQGGRIFASKDFAVQEIAQTTYIYTRNYEELIGYENKESTTNLRFEDWFIEKDAGMKTEVDGFISALNNINTQNNPQALQQIKTLVEDSAQDIWEQAVDFVQANNNANPDDRPLYWARNKMLVALKSHSYFTGEDDVDLKELIKIFEEKSRNYLGVDFSSHPTHKKILITGFDPFFLNKKTPGHNILQSNPSGCVALSLHNTITPNNLGFIQAMIVPVRYTDFDSSTDRSKGQGEGIIEKYIQPWINSVDMIITISQSGPGQYNIDKYATATRGGAIDNLGYTRKIPSAGRSINISSNKNLEWILTTLPNQFIQSPIVSNAEYIDKNGNSKDGNISGQEPVSGEQMLYGPGGDYLSNEIFYRVSRLRELSSRKIGSSNVLSSGHFHISKIQVGQNDFSASQTAQLISIVKNSINNGVTGI